MKQYIELITSSTFRTRTFLFLSGLFIASCIVFMNSRLNSYQLDNIDTVYMGTRLNTLNEYLGLLDSGFPVPVSRISESYYVFYLYASYFGHILGITQAWQLFLIIQMIFGFILLLFYPLITYKITKSIILSVLSPVFIFQLTGRFLFMQKNDISWILAWIVIIGVPLLYIYYEENNTKTATLVFVTICLIIGVSNVFRVHAALPITIIFAAIVLRKFVNKYKAGKENITLIFLLVSLIAIIFSYIFFTDIVNIIYAIITNRVSDLQRMGPWHTIYIGLGWEENPFNIIFNDACADNAAKGVNPDVIYCSGEYMDILKNLYLDLFKSNKSYFFLTYTKKLFVCIYWDISYSIKHEQGFSFIIYIICFLSVLYIFFKQKDIIRNIVKQYGLLFAICFILIFGMLLYPMMAHPNLPYLYGSLAACEMLIFFVLLALLQRFIIVVSKQYNGEGA